MKVDNYGLQKSMNGTSAKVREAREFQIVGAAKEKTLSACLDLINGIIIFVLKR